MLFFSPRLNNLWTTKAKSVLLSITYGVTYFSLEILAARGSLYSFLFKELLRSFHLFILYLPDKVFLMRTSTTETDYIFFNKVEFEFILFKLVVADSLGKSSFSSYSSSNISSSVPKSLSSSSLESSLVLSWILFIYLYNLFQAIKDCLILSRKEPEILTVIGVSNFRFIELNL